MSPIASLHYRRPGENASATLHFQIGWSIRRQWARKTPQTSTKAAEYPYAHVEAALAATFGVDVTGKVGWLRGRIQHLRRLGLTPPGPGKGATIRYRLDDVDRWLLALELEHFRIDPTVAVAAVKNNWKGPGMLRDLVAEARASRDSVDDVLMTVDFGPLASVPTIGRWTLKGIGDLGVWLAGPSPPNFGVVCRASIFNLSSESERSTERWPHRRRRRSLTAWQALF